MRPTASERSLAADLRALDRLRGNARVKAPTTWRLREAVEEVLFTSPLPPGVLRDQLERLAIALAYDGDRGIEVVADSVTCVEELLAKAREVVP